jgi:3-(3-hydroxy-phenyl)propionate hydroxylase
LPNGRQVRLDDASGGGWLLITRTLIEFSDEPLRIWNELAGTTLVIGRDIEDSEGHLDAWLDRHGAIAAIVRPDFYTFALPRDEEEVSAAVEGLGAALYLKPSVLAA